MPQTETITLSTDATATVTQNLTLRRLLFSFKGRIGNGAFVGGLLSFTGIYIAGVVMSLQVPNVLTQQALEIARTGGEYFRYATLAADVVFLMGFSFGAMCLWILLAVATKRCHDLNRNGFALGFVAIPVLNLLFILWLFLGQGTQGPNEYGTTMRMWGWRRLQATIAILLLIILFALFLMPYVMRLSH
jgi:uncharacterized membrane protein YhaH (DUF805 family)